jgi:hypothetical protein
MKWQWVVFLLVALAQVGGAAEYLAVGHDNWYQNPGLESLLAWHHKRGIETRLIHKSNWTASEIRDSIIAEYSRHSPPALRWVLLVGEYSEIPMYCLGGVANSDFWYADLSEPLDNYPEVGVARLSPQTQADLMNQTAKILRYMRDPPHETPWPDRFLLLADSAGSAGQVMRGIYTMPLPWFRPDFDTLMTQRVNDDSLRARLDMGAGALSYLGHGDIDQWYTTHGWSWDIADIGALNNGGMTPVVFSFAPLCGDIYQPTCLAEAWLRKNPGGAVACYAATQAAYSGPDRGMCSTAVRCLGDTWTINVPGVRDYCNPVFDLGGIMQNCAAYVARYWPASPYPDNIYMYLMLGDPAMEIWSGGQPVAPTVVYPPTVPLGETDLPVSVRVDGRAVKGALVCAWKEPEFYVTGLTDDSGSATLAINALTPGDFWVTASSGHATSQPHTPILPFEGTCSAVSGGIAVGPHTTTLALQVSGISASRAVRFDYSCPAPARLEVLDAAGRYAQVRSVPAGRGSILWDAFDAPAGVYFCRLESEGRNVTRKLVLSQ